MAQRLLCECWAASVAQAFYFRPWHAVYVAVTRMYLLGGRVAEGALLQYL